MAVIKKDARGGRGTYATLAQVVNYVDEQGFDLTPVCGYGRQEEGHGQVDCQ